MKMSFGLDEEDDDVDAEVAATTAVVNKISSWIFRCSSNRL